MSHVEYGRAVRARIAARGVTIKATAQAVGVSITTLHNWIAGESIPSPDHAMRLSQALDDGWLYQRAIYARSRECAYCGTRIVNRGGAQPRKWCSGRCRHRARTRLEPAIAPERFGIIAKCRQCEPEGACYDGSCPLREWSPFPLVQDLHVQSVVPVALSRTRAHRERLSEVMRQRWADGKYRHLVASGQADASPGAGTIGAPPPTRTGSTAP